LKNKNLMSLIITNQQSLKVQEQIPLQQNRLNNKWKQDLDRLDKLFILRANKAKIDTLLKLKVILNILMLIHKWKEQFNSD
jgi:hypothetical protein